MPHFMGTVPVKRDLVISNHTFEVYQHLKKISHIITNQL